MPPIPATIRAPRAMPRPDAASAAPKQGGILRLRRAGGFVITDDSRDGILRAAHVGFTTPSAGFAAGAARRAAPPRRAARARGRRAGGDRAALRHAAGGNESRPSGCPSTSATAASRRRSSATFNLRLMTRIAVGPGWAQLAADQQQRLSAAFSRYTISDYANRFDDYGGERFEVDRRPRRPTPTASSSTAGWSSRTAKRSRSTT